MDHFHTKTHKLKGSIFPNIQENIKYTKKVMQNCNDLVQKQFKIGINHEISLYIVYMDGLVDTEMLQESVIRPLLQDSFPQERTAIDQYVIESADWKWINTMEDAMTAILSGNTVLFLDKKQGQSYFPVNHSQQEVCKMRIRKWRSLVPRIVLRRV